MGKKVGSIPVNSFGSNSGAGISIERVAFHDLPDLGEWEQPERHDRHSFFLVEKGTVNIEIDFQEYLIKAPAVIYMHPDQVHRIIAFQNITVSALGIDNQRLNPNHIKILENLASATPVFLNKSDFELLSETASLCLKINERGKDEFYSEALKDSCNALAALIIALYQQHQQPAERLLRAEQVTKLFRETLSLHFTTLKRPADYAEKMHLSTPYLNECVKNTSGQSVTYHIQQRVMLEAKRLLYHSSQSLKEIAASLGYDDYAYFSRLFAKVTGQPPLVFRRKNLG